MRVPFLALAMLLSLSSATFAAEEAIIVSDGWAWPTARSSRTGAVYMKITNEGAETDTLLSIAAEESDKAQLRVRSVDSNGAIQMDELKSSLKVSPGETVELSPYGTHIALNGLKKPLEKGQKIELVLQFKKAGAVHATVEVMSRGYTPDRKEKP